MRWGWSANRPIWVRRTLNAALSAVLALNLAGCSVDPARTGRAAGALAGAVAAAFGPDGRLWRATADTQHVYVDASSDSGKSFSTPVSVNLQAQAINASSDDRPNIVVDKAGRIFVTYAADAAQPRTAYFSYSDDGGKSFSEPVPVSDQAASARAFLARLAVDGEGRLHFFWHDERDGNGGHNPDRGGSLYYARLDAPTARTPVAKRVLRTACERCPVEIAFDSDGLPVLFGRFVFPIKERDHGLVKGTSDGRGWSSWRVTDDDWEADVCPAQGPAFAVGPDWRYHVAWFTQGQNRQGLFYARSGDHGKHFSPFMPFGDAKALASHPVLLSLGPRVALVWQELYGRRTHIKALLSPDGGEHWAGVKTVAQAKGAADYPLLVSDGRQIFLSWNSGEQGYRLIALE